MANYSVTPKYPYVSDVQAVAKMLASRQSDSATNYWGSGGITSGIGNTPVPLIAVPPGQSAPNSGGSDTLGMQLAYLQGMSDALLCSVGYQAQNDSGGSTANTTTTYPSFTACNGFATWNVAIPVAKTYLIHVDLGAYFATVAGTIFWQVTASHTGDATVLGNNSSSVLTNPTTGFNFAASFRVPMQFTSAATWSISLNWAASSGATGNTNANSWRTFTITG